MTFFQDCEKNKPSSLLLLLLSKELKKNTSPLYGIITEVFTHETAFPSSQRLLPF